MKINIGINLLHKSDNLQRIFHLKIFQQFTKMFSKITLYQM